MAARKPAYQLPSDDKPVYTPAYKGDIPAWNVDGSGERARTSIGLLKDWQVNREGLQDIQNGRDTVKYWRLATTQRDAYLAIRTIISASFWVKGSIVAQNSYDKNPEYESIDIEIISLINDMINTFKYQSFESSLEDLMLWAMICGFGVSEKVWEPVDGVWWLRALKGKPSYDFTPIIDPWYNLAGVWHYLTGIMFHPDAFVYAPWPRVVGGNWLGLSELQSVRHDILLLGKMEEAQVKNALILSSRPMIDEYMAPAMSQAEIVNHKKMIDESVSGKGGGMIHAPAGIDNEGGLASMFRLYVPDDRTSVGALNVLDKSISESKKEIKRSLGLPDDLGNTTTGSGSWAKAQSVFNLMVSRAEEGQRWIRDVINRHVICDIIRFNYPLLPLDYKYPSWEYPEIQEEFSLNKASFIDSLIKSGVLTSDNADAEWARDFLGLPPLPKDEMEADNAGTIEIPSL